MTLAAARFHPWLKSCAPAYTEAQRREMTRSPSPESFPANSSMLSSIPDGDESFRSPDAVVDAGMSQGLQHLQLETVDASQDSAAVMVSNIPGAYPNGGLRREGSRTAPLQRRSLVLSQAAEGEGAAVPEPSWEMIHNAKTYDNRRNENSDNEAGPSNGAARGNKRVHSELTPLPEEFESDMSGGGPLADANASPARKKGKNRLADANGDGQGPAGGRGGKAGRGKGKAAPPSARSLRPRSGGQKEDAMSDEDERAGGQKPRRSSRQTPQKVARRV